MKRWVGLMLAMLIMLSASGDGFAYTDIDLYTSHAGKIDFTATGRTLKTGSLTVTTSGSNTLALPEGVAVKAAYLYWAGSWNSQDTDSSEDYNVTLTHDSNPPLAITGADRTFTEDFARFDDLADSNEDYFGGFKDVTTYVSTHGAGTYTLSDLEVWTGLPHWNFGTIISGWALFVVYEYPEPTTEPLRVINVYDGFKLYYSDTDRDFIDLTPSNFVIPSTTIDGKHGHLSWEGDEGNTDIYENLYFNGSVITSTANPENNQYNSTFNFPDNDPNSGLTSSSGNDPDALGMDLDFYDISGYLTAGDTSATTRYQTGGDMVLLNVEIISVTNTDVADLEITMLPSGNFISGGSGTYTIDVRNNGPSDAAGVVVTNELPAGITYVSDSGTDWGTIVTDNAGITTVTWTWQGTLPVPANTDLPQITLNVAVDSSAVGAGGTVSNSVEVDGGPSGTFDNNQANNTSTAAADTIQLSVAKTSSAGGIAKPGDTLNYSVTLTNTGSVTNTSVVLTDTIPPGTSCMESPIRVTEYYIPSGVFTGNTYDLTLNQALSPNYYVIIQGGAGNGSRNGNVGPASNYASLISDPFLTGDLADSGNPAVIGLTRGGTDNSWSGVVTVVESQSDEDQNGFRLRDVQRVLHSGSDLSGADTSASWTDINQVMLMGGFNGAGCDTTETAAANTKTCHVRLYPEGAGTILWTRDDGGATLSTATSTVMVVEWGNAWTVQRVNVNGTNGADGANDVSAYNTASLATSVARDSTWVWGTGHTDDNGIGDAAEAVLITLGDGVAQNATESSVAIGCEYNGTSMDFEVYALTHPDLFVDYRFKTDGDTNLTSVAVDADPAGSNRMAFVTNGQNSTRTRYPRPMFSARYVTDSSIQLERTRSGEPFPAWVQGIDFSNILVQSICPNELISASDGVDLAFNESVTVDYSVRIDDTVPEGSIVINGVEAYSTELPQSNAATASVSDYIPAFDSTDSISGQESNLFKRDTVGTNHDPVTMTGSGYAPDTSYVTAFYDASGTLVYSESQASDPSGNFSSTYDNSIDAVSYGTWAAVVMPGGYIPESTLANQMLILPTGVTDVFTVSCDGLVEFTDDTGSSVNGYDMTTGSNTVYVMVTDSAANVAASAIDTVVVTVRDDITGDSETLTLVETGNNTGIFTNQGSGLTVSLSGGAGTNNGTLNAAGDNSIIVDYTDTNGTLYSDEVYIPLLVFLSSFGAVEEDGTMVVVWETASEIGTVGFYLNRKDPLTGKYVRVNEQLLPGLIVSPQGGAYYYTDTEAVPGNVYTYMLSEVEVSGVVRNYGPFTVSVDSSVSGSLIKAFQAKGPAGFKRIPRQSGSVLNYGRKAHLANSHGRSKSSAEFSKQKQFNLFEFLMMVFSYSANSGDTMKITTDEDGLYRVDVSDISMSLGLSESYVRKLIRRNRLSLKKEGVEVAWMPSDSNSGILFYSDQPENQFRNTNVYLLEAGKGRSMKSALAGFTGSSEQALSFSATTHAEEDKWPLTAFFKNPYDDYWVGDYVVSGYSGMDTVDIQVPATGLSEHCESAELTVTLQGGSSSGAVQDHHADIAVNGVQVGSARFDGTDETVVVMSVDCSVIDEINRVSITGILDDGVPYSVFYLQSADLTYQKDYAAADDSLTATGQDDKGIYATGFESSVIRVLDITNPVHPLKLRDISVNTNEGDWSAEFYSDSSEKKYYMVGESGIKSPFLTETIKKTDLKSRWNDEDYLIIAPAEFETVAGELADYRAGQGHRVRIVTVDTIMNEFNYGAYNPEAIADFLDYAWHNWRKRPRYVVLAGDGTYDYKNVQGYGDNCVPPVMAGTGSGLFPSDNSLADVSGFDGIPDIAIGRIPVKTPEEFSRMIDRIIGYESGRSRGKQVMMVSDNPDTGGNFPAASAFVAEQVPQEYALDFLELGEGDTDIVRSEMLDGMNSGPLFYNYIGHGSVSQLAHEGLLGLSHLDSLSNSETLSVMSLMTCVSGLYAIPGYDSLGEGLLKGINGGASAVWGPTGPTLSKNLRILNAAYFEAVLKDKRRTIGDAVVQAYRNYAEQTGDTEHIALFVLLGDPAMRIVR